MARIVDVAHSRGEDLVLMCIHHDTFGLRVSQKVFILPVLQGLEGIMNEYDGITSLCSAVREATGKEYELKLETINGLDRRTECFHNYHARTGGTLLVRGGILLNLNHLFCRLQNVISIETSRSKFFLQIHFYGVRAQLTHLVARWSGPRLGYRGRELQFA